MSVPKFSVCDSALLIVDMQQRLVPVMDNSQQLLRQTARIAKGAKILNLPIIVTEQYPKGLGKTIDQISNFLFNNSDSSGEVGLKNSDWTIARFEKLQFSACIKPVLETLKEHNITSVVVAGIETHICVEQTCLDLINSGYITAIVHDATSSRSQIDCQTALKRISQAGAIPVTVESILMELLREAGNKKFKEIQNIIKDIY